MSIWARIRSSIVCLAALLLTVVASGCGGSEPESAAPREVVLVTHDSFAVSKPLRAAFQTETGFTLRILQQGDAGEVVNRALLTAGDPEGDVLFGIDDSLLSRALENDLFAPYTAQGRDAIAEPFRADENLMTPIDHGDVCLNVDRSFYAGRAGGAPRGLDDLRLPRYSGQLVVENPATSSPGLAFLFATVARYGDGWKAYWHALRANEVLVTDGWEAAYTQQFSGAAGSPGKRPIVVSYATSPAAEVIFAGRPLSESPTAAIEDGCYRQVEYAGVLRGARNEDGARRLIDFLLSQGFQEGVPGSMFVLPVRAGVAIPSEFERFAIDPAAPLSLAPDTIARNRDAWVKEWTRIVLR